MSEPTAAPAPDRARASLLARVVALIGLAFFAVELALLAVFTAGYWTWLARDRRDALREHGVQVQAHAAPALREAMATDPDTPVDSALTDALRSPGAAPGAPPSRRFQAPGAVAQAWVITRSGEVWRWVGSGVERDLDAASSPQARWTPAVAAEVEELFTGKDVAATFEADLSEGPGLPDRAVWAAPLHTGGGQGPPEAIVYLEASLEDVQKQVATYGLAAFVTGAGALFITAMVVLGYLRRALLLPLSRMIRADDAAREGDTKGAVIDAGDIPDDEVGAIMRSRNDLFLALLAHREDLDEKNAELEKQREELRAWGRELERLVAQKTTALLQARDRLHSTEKLAALGRLAANVAHEINNPLATIAGWAESAREELAQGPPDAPELERALRTIEEQAWRCKETLKRLLGLARSDAQVEVKEVHVGALLRETAELARPGATRKKVALRVAGEGDGPRVRSDAGALQQVILNLVDNAVDAAACATEGEAPPELRDQPPREASTGARAPGQDGEPRDQGRASASAPMAGAPPSAPSPGPWVEMSARFVQGDGASGGGGGVVIIVSDSGRGVPPGLRERVFDPFYTTKPVGRGTGLGLAICQSLVERLGGTIAVDDHPGGGASFRVTLPREPRQPSPSARFARGAIVAPEGSAMLEAQIRSAGARADDPDH